jgi:hypothetical protein
LGRCVLSGARLLLAVAVLALTPFLEPSRLAAQERPAESDRATADVEEMVTDRPDVTESTSIVPTGWVQAETGATLLRETGASTLLGGPGTLVRVGLVSRVEGRLGWLGILHRDGGDEEDLACSDCDEATDAGDGSAGIKVRLFERRGARPDLALLPFVTLPIGADPFTTGRVDPGFKILLANGISERFDWAANLGAVWLTDETGRERPGSATWSLSLGLDLGGGLGAFFEYFGENTEDEPASHALDTGLTLGLGPNAQLDASGGLGVVRDAPNWFVGAGLAFRFGP